MAVRIPRAPRPTPVRLIYRRTGCRDGGRPSRRAPTHAALHRSTASTPPAKAHPRRRRRARAFAATPTTASAFRAFFLTKARQRMVPSFNPTDSGGRTRPDASRSSTAMRARAVVVPACRRRAAVTTSRAANAFPSKATSSAGSKHPTRFVGRTTSTPFACCAPRMRAAPRMPRTKSILSPRPNFSARTAARCVAEPRGERSNENDPFGNFGASSAIGLRTG